MKHYYISLLFIICFTFPTWSQEYKEMIIKSTYSVQEIQAKAEEHFAIVGKERGKGYKPYKRWEYNALRNMDESGHLKSPDFYYSELERYNRYRNNNNVLARNNQGGWEELGPTYWDDTSGWNPGVGRITSVSVESNNTNHIIVGGASGGVWKTIDGGANWTVLTDNMSNLIVSSLTINPLDNTNYFWGSSNGTIFTSTDSGSTWTLLSDTGSGNVNKILIDPTDATKMFCSVQGGGIYKSTDSGVNWTIIHPLATNGYDVEFKPGNTNVIYATGSKFFKSIDGGVTFTTEDDVLSVYQQQYVSGATSWQFATSNLDNSVTPKTGNGLGLFYITDFTNPVTRLIPPAVNLTGATAPKLKFSYTNVNWDDDIDELRVLYKTSVGGTWTVLATYTTEASTWQDITIDLPNQSSEYYVALEGKSNYGRGVTLDDISIVDVTLGTLFENGFESNLPLSTGPKMMGVSPNDPNIVYILEAKNGKFGAFYKSINSGDTFVKLNHGNKNYFGYSSLADDDRGQAPRDMDIAVNPNDANDVHIAGILSWRSTNGGQNFSITSQWVPQDAANQNIGYCHADIDIMEYVGEKLYVGSDGGIFVAENPLVVNSNYFTDLSTGLGIKQFYKIGVSQTSPEVISAGSQDNGSSVYNSLGNWKDWLGADGMESFVDKNNSNILYGTTQQGSLYKSTNQGTSYFGLASPEDKSGNWITPFEQDPIVQNTIYSGYDKVYKSTNGGNSWVSISQLFAGNLDHLKIAPSNNNIMFAAIGGSLYKTIDGGATNWVALNGFAGSINSIAIHPTDANKIAIATTGNQKVYISTDGGTNWTSYLKNLPNFSALALVWTNYQQEGLYVGMNYGVFYIATADPLAEWQPFSNNLPNVQISELEINTANNKIYAGTFGRGLWKSNLFETALSIDNFDALNTITLFPNPATNKVNLKWNENENVTIKIYDASGKLVYYTKDKNLINTFEVNTSSFTSGLYFVNINTIDKFVIKKLIIE
ncbi:T9SS type A sorting domain-containing protein [Flavobacterium sediminilitoris]|uniref:T9SS type A sorting domain-containing protein n=1 Tax=Flavobacterium sediminilitoris TaxID=2024526 RepID=A0ABY4HIV9_9FLAO|nr:MULTISPECIES: T9SS type A sorting domain-containing protein [Flavobacterium]UOX32771.1 T9SS type A sorting domain-containing protein [Flavobacterium sediminilitoris]